MSQFFALLTAVMTLLSIWFGVTRLSMDIVSEIHHEDLFKDFAHLLVGGLFGLALGLTGWRLYLGWLQTSLRRSVSTSVDTLLTLRYGVTTATWLMAYFWVLAWGMTVLEVIAFKLHKA